MFSQTSPDDFEKYDMQWIIPQYSNENFPNTLKVVEEVQQIGVKHDASAGQVMLAWLFAQGPDVVPIPGTRNVKVRKKKQKERNSSADTLLVQCLNENLASLDVKLSPEEVQEVRNIAELADAVLGEHYPCRDGRDALC